MSKIVVIGDIHCRDVWKQILVNEQTFDKVVFMGDYFDTFEETPIKEWIDNFSNIMNLRYDYPGQIINLIGNHDYHYVEGVYESYSGYRQKHRLSIENIIKFHKDNLQICHVHDNFLFSHAGVTKTWYKNQKRRFDDYALNLDLTIEQQINTLFNIDKRPFGFTSGLNRDPYGDDVTQPPIWVRPESLVIDALDGYIHVVGHTQTPVNITEKVIYVDSLEYNQYLVLENNKPIIKTF